MALQIPPLESGQAPFQARLFCARYVREPHEADQSPAASRAIRNWLRARERSSLAPETER